MSAKFIQFVLLAVVAFVVWRLLRGRRG